MWRETLWQALIMFSNSATISDLASPPPSAAFMPFPLVQSYNSPTPYLPTATPLNIANIESIIERMSSAAEHENGNGLTAEDIVKLQEIASISNETLQTASAYLKHLAEYYNGQKQETSNNNLKLVPPNNDQLWPADSPSREADMGGESWSNWATQPWSKSFDKEDQVQSTSQTPAPVISSGQFMHSVTDGSSQQSVTDASSNSTSSRSLAAELGLGIGIPLLVLAVIAVVLIIRKKRMREHLRHRASFSASDECSMSKKGGGVRMQNSYLNEKEQHNKLGGDKTNPWWLEKSRLVVFHEMKLGSGAFCDVYKGAIEGLAPVCKVNPSLIAYGTFKDCMCAVKMLPPFADDIARSDFMQEIKFMKSLKYHPHLVSMLGVSADADQNLMLLIEYCDLGDLLHLVRARKDEIIKGHVNEYIGLRIKDLVSFAWQISDGLEYLSSIGCVHRDVAARNVLVNAANVCKIGDFGLCRLSDCLIYTGRGGRLPLKWMAPESLRSYEYSNKTDVWSFGVLLFEVFSFGEVPYALIQTTEILSFLESGARLTRPEYCPTDIYALMLQCWQFEAPLRPNFTEICSYLRVILENSSEHYGYVEAVESSSDQINR